MTPRRPHPGPEPTPAAWWTVARAMVVVLVEILGQGCRLVTFTLTRDRWRREITRRVRRGALPPASAPRDSAPQLMNRGSS